MRKTIYCLVFVQIAALLACQKTTSLEEADVAKIWRLAEVVSVNSVDKETGKSMKPAINASLTADGFLLCLFPDKSYTQIKGYACETGRWAWVNGDEIHFGDNRLIINKIEAINANRFIVGDTKIKEGDLTLKWLEESGMLAQFKDDPFYPDHNKWRQKPNQKETDAAIKERLLNYLYHFALILNASIERNSSVVSFSHSLGIIKVYRGGIGAINVEQIPDEWKNCFFDEEDAMKAYRLFYGQIGKEAYRGATTGDWVKDDYNILMHLYHQLKNSDLE